MQKIKKIKKLRMGFTLVEIIIVIMILSVLTSLAIINYQGYSSNARDSARISTSKAMYQGLEVFYTKTGKFPIPDGALTLSGLSMQGIVGEGVTREILFSGKSSDPKDSSKSYIYTVTPNRTKAQVGIVLENGTVNQLGILPNVYAQQNICEGMFNCGGLVGVVIDDGKQKPIHLVYSGTFDIESTGSYEVCFPDTGSKKYVSGSGQNLIDEIITVQDSCILGDKVVKAKETVRAYKSLTVPFESTCDPLIRTCINGKLEGDNLYRFDACTVRPPLSCTGTTYRGYPEHYLNHGDTDQTVTKSISHGTQSILASCYNGTLSYGSESITCNSGYLLEEGICIPKTFTSTQSLSYHARTYIFESFTISYDTPVAKTSTSTIISGGTSTLTATFTLGTDGTSVSVSGQTENISCSENYSLSEANCFANIINASGRKWADGTVASSCNAYRNPTGNYMYAGSTGNGLYWINPDGGGAFTIYCDMTMDTYGRALVMQFKSSSSVFDYNSTYWTNDTNIGTSTEVLGDVDMRVNRSRISNQKLKLCMENSGRKCYEVSYSGTLKSYAGLQTSTQIGYNHSGITTQTNADNFITTLGFTTNGTIYCNGQHTGAYTKVRIGVNKNNSVSEGCNTSDDYAWGFGLFSTYSTTDIESGYITTAFPIGGSTGKAGYIFVK